MFHLPPSSTSIIYIYCDAVGFKNKELFSIDELSIEYLKGIGDCSGINSAISLISVDQNISH